MTSRYDTLTVTFEEPIREDDLQVWIDAIRLMDKVESVEPGRVDDLAKHKAKRELRQELFGLVD